MCLVRALTVAGGMQGVCWRRMRTSHACRLPSMTGAEKPAGPARRPWGGWLQGLPEGSEEGQAKGGRGRRKATSGGAQTG